jgi:hypothetical protein
MVDAFEGLLIERFVLSSTEFERRLREVRAEQWAWSTPCAEWNVHQLVNHRSTAISMRSTPGWRKRPSLLSRPIDSLPLPRARLLTTRRNRIGCCTEWAENPNAVAEVHRHGATGETRTYSLRCANHGGGLLPGWPHPTRPSSVAAAVAGRPRSRGVTWGPVHGPSGLPAPDPGDCRRVRRNRARDSRGGTAPARRAPHGGDGAPTSRRTGAHGHVDEGVVEHGDGCPLPARHRGDATWRRRPDRRPAVEAADVGQRTGELSAGAPRRDQLPPELQPQRQRPGCPDGRPGRLHWSHWRRMRDSNPRGREPNTLSKRAP